MDLAINVIFPLSLVIFIFGFFYNVIQYFIIPGAPRAYSPPRKISVIKKLLMPVIKWLSTFKFIIKKNPLHGFTAIFMFHLPLLAVMLLFPPHQAVIFSILPFLRVILEPFAIPQQPTETFFTNRTIWGPLEVIVNADVLALITIFSIMIIMGLRIVKHATGEFASTVGDYFALIITLLILVFGYLATHAHGTPYYETYLAAHIISASFLIAYVPFSKFFHFVWSYWVNLIVLAYHRMRKGV